MNIQEFTTVIQKQFSDDSVNLTPDADFRDNDDFDSLVGMAILMTIKDKFDYDMSVEEFLRCKTPAELYNAIHKNCT